MQEAANCTPKIHPLGWSDLHAGSNKENPMRRKRNHVIQNTILRIDDLQNITHFGAEPERILDDEELLFLRRPEQPPGTRKIWPGGDRIGTEDRNLFDGLDDFGAHGRVFQGFDASLLVGNEG